MTERELLETTLQKLVSVDSRLNNIESRLHNIEVRLDNVENRLGNVEGQLQKNTNILRALEHKAEMDNLSYRVINLESAVKEIRDDQKSFFEIVGEHEVSIRTLRRRA